VALIGLLGRRVASPAVGLGAAALAAVYPMLFLSEGIGMAEALYAPLVAAMLLLAYRAHDAPTTRRFVALGVAIGLATLTRAEGLMLGIVLVFPLCLWLRGLTMRRRVMFAATALSVAVALVAPWTIRNAARFHAFVPVSNNFATLVDGANCDATYHGAQLGLWRESFSTSGTVVRSLPQAQACFEGFDIAGPRFDEVDAATTHTRDGLSYARHRLETFPKVMAVRVLRTWGLYAPRRQIDFETFEGRPHTWQTLGTVMYWTFATLAIAGVVLLRRERTWLWPLAATVITVSVVAALTYGQQRFRIAAEPAVLVLAAATLVRLGRFARERFTP
jgi:4-amino-4-deoxy-L-arabinose transferase-like glycosyltransferase